MMKDDSYMHKADLDLLKKEKGNYKKKMWPAQSPHRCKRKTRETVKKWPPRTLWAVNDTYGSRYAWTSSGTKGALVRRKAKTSLSQRFCCCCASGFKLWHVVVFLHLRWLRCMPCTRQSGMEPSSHVLPLIVPVRLCCQRLRRTTKGRRQRAEQHNSKTFLLVSNVNCVFVIFNCARFMQLAAAPLESAARVALYRLGDKQEESCGGAGNKLPTPSPSGHSPFYIPPSISITIAGTGPRARHTVGDSAERMHTRSWSEEPAAWRGW